MLLSDRLLAISASMGSATERVSTQPIGEKRQSNEKDPIAQASTEKLVPATQQFARLSWQLLVKCKMNEIRRYKPSYTSETAQTSKTPTMHSEKFPQGGMQHWRIHTPSAAASAVAKSRAGGIWSRFS